MIPENRIKEDEARVKQAVKELISNLASTVEIGNEWKKISPAKQSKIAKAWCEIVYLELFL